MHDTGTELKEFCSSPAGWNKKICSSWCHVKRNSPRHHSARNASGGLCPGRLLRLSQGGSECVVVQTCQWEHLVWGCLLGAVHKGGVGISSSPIPCAEQGDSISGAKTAFSMVARDIPWIPSAKCWASQRSTHCPSQGFCTMRSWVCHNLYHCFILNSLVVPLIS